MSPCSLFSFRLLQISDREVYTREFHGVRGSLCGYTALALAIYVQPLTRHSSASDAYYRVFPYVLVKTLVEIPAAFVSSLVFTAIIYPSIGLRSGGPSFLFFALATAVNVIISALIGCGGCITNALLERA